MELDQVKHNLEDQILKFKESLQEGVFEGDVHPILDSKIDFKDDQKSPYFDVNSKDILKSDFNFEINDEKGGVKTSLRMTYEAQIKVIKQQIGDLEFVRAQLGLSQRKMAQLLMVDPSAWTRWTRKGDEAPPHIWRALQWYLTLQDKIPGLTAHYFIGKDPRVFHDQTIKQIEAEKASRIEFQNFFENELKSQYVELQRSHTNLVDSQFQLQQEISNLKDQNKYFKWGLYFLFVSSVLLGGFLIKQLLKT